jgi:cytochrome c oxidase assembly protein subunit 15
VEPTSPETCDLARWKRGAYIPAHMPSPRQMAMLSEVSPPSEDAQRAFGKVAWQVLAYTVLVILFGAVVRITGSGAGCGQHWPTCQGEVFHLPRTVATAIELSHRLTSGLSGLLVTGLVFLAFRRFPARHPTRRAATAATLLMGTEALVGAALVKLSLVAENASVLRAVVMSLHLVNTSFLAGAIALTAWTATHRPPRTWRPEQALDWTLLAALVAVLAVSVTGALTALGDTLYPVTAASGDLVTRLAADHARAATFLERGRAVHPLVAVTAAVFVLAVAWKTPDQRPHPEVDRASRLVIALVFTQVGAGVLNVLLSAPGWMQVVHLGVGTTLWIALVVFYATARSFGPSHAA